MPLATPEQIKIVQHRRKVWGTTCIAIGVSWIAPLIVMQQFSDSVAVRKVFTDWLFFGWLFGGASMLIFTTLYLRCPVCNRAFSRYSLAKKCCQHCDTSYDA
jgi:hypothetical protein